MSARGYQRSLDAGTSPTPPGGGTSGPMVATEAWVEGAVLGDCELERALPGARGGFGVIWTATQPDNARRRVAIKRFDPLPEFRSQPDLLAEARTRFDNERRALASIDHPNVVKVYRGGHHAGSPYLVMDYVQGETLEDRLDRAPSAPLTHDEIRTILDQLCEGLAAVHAATLVDNRPILHRDIKPANIMLQRLDTGSTLVKIVDFGIARYGARGVTTAGQPGTREFMALELLNHQTGDEPTASVDVFAAAVIAVAMFRTETSSTRYLMDRGLWCVGTHKMTDEARLAAVERIAPTMPDAVRRVISLSLAADPTKRPADGYSLLIALREAWAQAQNPAAPAPAGILQRIGRSVSTVFGAVVSPKQRPSDPVPAPAPRPMTQISPRVPVRRDESLLRWDASEPLPTRMRRKEDDDGRAHKVYLHLLGDTDATMEMVYIPPGTFRMGDEKPTRKTTLTQGYYLARYPVTVGQFRRFVKATKWVTDEERDPLTWSRLYEYLEFGGGDESKVYGGATWRSPGIAQTDDHPVVLVSWSDAKAFCDWAGLVLPTEAQWERAARGDDQRHYPWGPKEEGPNNDRLWWSGSGIDREGTCSVLDLPGATSAFGARHLAGNIWEWTADWYDDHYDPKALTDPTGPKDGKYRVVRGGAWYDCDAARVRAADRGWDHPLPWDQRVGFRCARGST